MQMICNTEIFPNSGTNIKNNASNTFLDLSEIQIKTTTGAVSQLRQPLPVCDESILIAIGEQQARGLIETLDLLKLSREDVVYEIASLFEPYIQTVDDLDFSITPQFSREVTVTVTRKVWPEQELFID